MHLKIDRLSSTHFREQVQWTNLSIVTLLRQYGNIRVHTVPYIKNKYFWMNIQDVNCKQCTSFFYASYCTVNIKTFFGVGQRDLISLKRQRCDICCLFAFLSGIKFFPPPKQQRRPLPFLLYLSFFYSKNFQNIAIKWFCCWLIKCLKLAVFSGTYSLWGNFQIRVFLLC